MKSIRFFIQFFCISICFPSYGQTDTFPTDQWIDALSSRKDEKSFHFARIKRAFYHLDSATTCQLLKMLRGEGPNHNRRFQIRLDLLQSFIRLHFNDCTGQRPSLDLLKEALQASYELGDEELIFQSHKALFNEFAVHPKDFGSATLHAIIAMQLADKLGEDRTYVGLVEWHNLGYVLYHSREYEASIKASEKSLLLSENLEDFPEDTLIPFFIMNANNTIGLCYEKLGKPDSAFLAFDVAMKYADLLKSEFWKGLIMGNKGDVYYQIAQYDSAEVCLQSDFKSSVNTAQFDNAANSLQWLARLELRKGNASSALDMLREATAYLKKSPNSTYNANLLYAYTQVFSKLGKADSMNTYMHQYIMLHDSIERVANNNRLDLVRMQLVNQANVYKVISLNKEKKSIATIRNFIIVFVILLAITGLTILNRQKLKLKFREQQVLEEKKQAEQESERAKAQLDIFTRHLIEKTNLVETLQEQLMHKEMSTEHLDRISALSRHSILTEEDWDQFKIIFEKVYPGFFHTLKQQFADITLAELRMAALCKLQLLPKEAANLLGISHNSVNKTRQRLRSRLGLDSDTNLELYFSS